MNSIESTNKFTVEDCLYEEVPIKNLEEFLLYFPLFNMDAMAMFLEHTPDVHDRENDIKNYWLSFLYKMLPETDAKRYADRAKYFYLTEPHVWSVKEGKHSDPIATKKLEEYEQYKSSECFERELVAYCNAQMACIKMLNDFAVFNRAMKREEYGLNYYEDESPNVEEHQ